MTDLPPETPVEPARRSLLQRLSIVWVIPAAALAIALGVAWNSYAERGPLLELTFQTASGIRAGETELRFRDVTVGLVESVAFTEGLDRVLVGVRLDRDVAEYVDDDAQFWAVRPEVTPQGVRGLETVLSGTFIEGIWDDTAEGFVARHAAATEPPLNREGRAGLRLRLRAAGTATFTENAPIVYRGIEVGRIGRAEVSADGATVEAEAIVFAPHDRLISSSTRFWDTSGFRFTLGPGGARLDFDSIASLVSGGITFRTEVSGGTQVVPEALFTVYPDEGAARASVFGAEAGEALTLTAIFDENVAGLAVDAPVDLGGIRVGRVAALSGIVDSARFGDDRVRLAVTLAIRPGQLGLGEAAAAGAALDYLAGRVAEGLRARLVTASILTGGLKVELVEIADAPAATLDRSAAPNPLIPTAPARIADVAATAEGLYNRINALPIEQVMDSAIAALDNIARLTGSDDIRAVPGEVRALLGEARGIVGAEETQGLPARLSATVGELETLVGRLNESDAAGRLSAAIDAAAAAAGTVESSVEGVPELVARLTAIAANAETVPLDELANRLSALMDAADRLIDTDAARALPADLSAALAELRAVLAELREGGVVENANATLASARAAADDISAAAQDLPGVLARAQAVLDEAAATIRGYDAARGVGRDLGPAIREVERAAKAVSDLARTLERNPNSILFGR
ncbi:MlaD family protein [Rhodovulum euryhalinum]|uniref:Paraquat-inducible protein B n=1 Tax=Rhodovulum euryhalinum TaxID=35805 RepID=A0A4V6NP93_9RHOB|nr:MlaD family protein [Rhodovulum euryhalinum]TCO70820.1 paraquat-inducible protein B [Rhodovulum euryhalinum]